MRSVPFLFSIVGVALLLAVSARDVNAQAGPKIGYVNSVAVYEQAPVAQAAQAQFEQEMNTYRQEVQRLGEELQAMVTEYGQQQATLSAEAREAREAAIREKDGAYRQRLAQLENEAGRRRQELVAPVTQRINDTVEALRKEGNYSLIFDVGPSSTIIAADPALDLTNEVISRLRAEDR